MEDEVVTASRAGTEWIEVDSEQEQIYREWANIKNAELSRKGEQIRYKIYTQLSQDEVETDVSFEEAKRVVAEQAKLEMERKLKAQQANEKRRRTTQRKKIQKQITELENTKKLLLKTSPETSTIEIDKTIKDLKAQVEKLK
jgi:hypothetical protein